jgi:hypothetical protein
MFTNKLFVSKEQCEAEFHMKAGSIIVQSGIGWQKQQYAERIN